jgi:prepilin-type N-terminal cleavage/methylation domain-containing protein
MLRSALLFFDEAGYYYRTNNCILEYVCMLNKKQMGFTLVEIAIVLVIVGLLIGGVLKGQEMITNARLKRIESDNAGLMAALYSYQDRYLQLPGDDSGAGSRFTVYTGDASGDGDGAIEGAWDRVPAPSDNWSQSTEYQESTKFFAHLRAAGLIAGGALDGNRPTNAFGGQIGIQNGALNMVGQITVFGGIEGGIASILDGRMDDGVQHTGRVRSQIVTDPMTPSTTPSSVGYSDSSSYHMAFRL